MPSGGKAPLFVRDQTYEGTADTAHQASQTHHSLRQAIRTETCHNAVSLVQCLPVEPFQVVGTAAVAFCSEGGGCPSKLSFFSLVKRGDEGTHPLPSPLLLELRRRGRSRELRVELAG